jgi:TldD protein
VKRANCIALLPLVALAASVRADRVEVPSSVESATVRAMKDELARSMAMLELASFGKPYFLSYELADETEGTFVASFGALVDSEVQPQRSVAIDLRVGDYAFDNSNFASSDGYGGGMDPSRSVGLPIDDNYDAVRHTLWLATDRAYKHAVETLEHKRAVVKAETKNVDDAGSFSKEPPSHIVDNHPQPAIDRARLEKLAKRLSAVFRSNPDIHVGRVTVHAGTARQTFVSSEGSQSLQTGGFVRVTVEGDGQADDGMPVHDSLAFYAESPDQLPPEPEMVAQIEALSKRVSALRTAPIVDDYAGPVVFDDVAAAQLLRALLADDLSGTPAPKSDRPGSHDDNNELVGKVGQRVLPVGTTVIDDPTAKRIGKATLAGMARFDDEGVPAQKVTLVEEGVFRRFLMSRIPRKGFEHSNGHAVATRMTAPRAHPMNVILSSSRGVSDSDLRRRAFAAAKEQGLKYVLFVDHLAVSARDDDSGAGESVPHPTVMRRVYLDGHEELVRGATFGELPMRTLKDVVAVGNAPVVYTYVGTAISNRFAAMLGGLGGYFASIASPALVMRDIDIKKPTGTHRKPPIAPRPR